MRSTTASGGRNRERELRKKHRESRTDVSESTMFLTGGFAVMFVLRTSDVATGVAVMCCFATLNSADAELNVAEPR